MQGNDVWDLSSWTGNLPSLTTLDLSENRLALISGLRSSTRLEDLSLRHQRTELPLRLHPPTMRTFSRSLRSLNISKNRMDDISPVGSLMMLQKLDASGNILTEMPHIGSVIRQLSRLNRLFLEDNPVCWMRKYRDMIIVAAQQCLEELDGKTVQPNERPFLVELHQRRRKRNSSEPPRRGAIESPGGSPPKPVTPCEERSASLGYPPRPPGGLPQAHIPCLPVKAPGGSRSRSSSTDPAGRHYRRRTGAPTAKLPPLPPRV